MSSPTVQYGDDAFEPHGASVLKYGLAVGTVDMLRKPDALAGFAQKACQRRPFLYAFDLLEINGTDLRRDAWRVRRGPFDHYRSCN